jgi:bifunctional UDP-N-acetylglucosamine pyrophosphorylase/glucosamine-1-phosphate N-acetyltransferase
MSSLHPGIRVRDPNTLYIRGSLEAGERVEIDVNVIIEGHVRLGDDVQIGPHCILKDCQIEAGTIVQAFSMVEQTRVGRNGLIGPYARVRPNCQLGDKVQVGNYVELKNAQLGNGCRINHHSFVGDAILKKT